MRHRPALIEYEQTLADADVMPLERAVIGAVMLEPTTRIPALLSEEFYPEHGAIWDAIVTVADRGERPDLATVQYELLRSGHLAHAGGPAKLAQCMEDGAVAAYLPQYARQLREAANARRLRALGAELQRAGLSETEIAERLDAMPGPLTSALYDATETWRRIQDAWSETRIRLGIEALDAMTGGLGRGEMIVVAGRTSHGKTAFTCDAALRLAKAGVPVEILTLEETQEAITRRLLSNLTGVETRRLKSGHLPHEDITAAGEAAAWLSSLPLTVTGLESVRAMDDASVTAVVAHSGATVVMLDHLQKIATRDDSRVYGLERVLNRLHATAIKDHRVVWVNAQLNRETEVRRGAPELSDLRDSGAIEILARQVWMLYWPIKHDANRNAYDYELYVRKNSEGGTGMVSLAFTPQSGRFQAL